MSDFQVDLSNRDLEPIHIPGEIQSHGYLIVLDQELNITHCSDNISKLFPTAGVDLIGTPLQNFELLIGNGHPSGFINNLISLGKVKKSFEQINPFEINISDSIYYLIISSTPDYYLIEFEPAISDLETNIQTLMGHSISRMLVHKNLQSLLDSSALQVKNIINYDRVMIYRFAADGHGEVVAEAKDDNIDSWLGLHYPASDIPKQAKELYKINLTRIIADVYTTPSKISAAANNIQPLDLTNSQLRAVSPVHIQYLKNMGVVSSFSISLIYKNELWGLIACHNYSPRFIDFKSRESSKLLGQILSSALDFRQEEIHQQTQEFFKNNLDIISKQLQKTISIEDALTKHPVTLLDVAHAGGAVLVYDRNIVKLGITPNDIQLANLISWLKQNNSKPSFYFENFSAIYPEAIEYSNIASGIMVSVLSKELEEYVIFFKPEQLQFITWAGNPEKPAEVNTNALMQISPRKSFEKWSETVTATSVSWSIEEISSILRLKEEIIYAINQKAVAIRQLNDKLQEAYDELDTFSFTISHDLKNPIAAIKSYAQLLTRENSFVSTEQNFLKRIVTKTDQMNLMINAVLDYSRIGRTELKYFKIDTRALIEDIIKDLDSTHKAPNLKITIGNTPDLQGDPTMMFQIFSNLIGNAVKYSRHAKNSQVHIEGIVTGSDICYTIKDNGLGIAEKDLPHVFELFNRMDNVKSIEGSGVGLAIVKRIVEKHKGRVWAESELNKGSAFHVSFNQ